MADKHYVSNSTESTRLFDNGLMEALSKVHFSVPLFIFIPLNSYLFYLGASSPVLSLGAIFLWIVAGLIAWTITEYVLHRFVFHFHPTSEFGKKIHFIFHGVHHDYPRDRLRLVMPPSVSIPLATAFFFFYKTFIPGDAIFPFFGAFLTGYLIYDMFHYAIHHLEVKGKMWNFLKTHHLKHHYVNPEKGFGVSIPLWDMIVSSNFDEKKAANRDVHAEHLA